jgi:hypothetical protein
MSVTAIHAPGNGRGTDIGFAPRPVPGEARRIAANVAKLRELLRRRPVLMSASGGKADISQCFIATAGVAVSKSLTALTVAVVAASS